MKLLHLSPRRALDTGALASVDATLERALQLHPDPSVRTVLMETLAEVLALAGRVDRAATVAQELLAMLGRAEAEGKRFAAVTC